MHGGVKFYRGSAAAARSYVEADRSRADDYYLAEGSGLAERYVASPGRRCVAAGERWTATTYERWVAGYDVETGRPKGRLRTDDAGGAVRRGRGQRPEDLVARRGAASRRSRRPTTPRRTRAAEEIIGWVAEHATTRVGPRGRQVQVPVEELEAAVVRHYTSRAGDPHRHLHLQINARVFARRGVAGAALGRGRRQHRGASTASATPR